MEPAGNQHAEDTFGTVNHAVNEILKANAGGFTQAGADNRKADTNKRRTHRGVAAAEEVDNRDKRDYQMSSFEENGFVARHFVTAHAFKAKLFSFKMYAQPDAGEVQQPPTNSAIRNAAAPITGGINWPPVEAAASTAPAKSLP